MVLMATLVAVAGSVPGKESWAHIVPVNFGSFDGSVAATNNGTGTGINSGTSGNYGWIDGADGDWADSHKVGYYRFSLTGQAADVTLTFRGKSNAFGGGGSDSRVYPLFRGGGICGGSRF
jgi:hypothetical protein